MLRHIRRRGLATSRTTLLKRGIQVRLHVSPLERRDAPAALAPTGLVATGTSATAISLSWNAPPDLTVTGYDVDEKIWVKTGGGKTGGTGHYVYTPVAIDLAETSDTITGLTGGSTHTYVVTSVNPTGTSGYSLPATAQTWVAPSEPYGSEFELSSGAVYSSPVNVTAGTSTQVILLIAGNPLSYSVVSGPATASVDPVRGVITYTPDLSEAGLVSITIQAANALGSVTQTIPFNVVAPVPGKITPTISFGAASFTYDGYAHAATATVVGTDGVTPVSGSLTFAYNGGLGAPLDVGTYGVLATFTSNDPNYGPATAFSTITVNKGAPAFNYVAASDIAAGTSSVAVSGFIWDGTAVPSGEEVAIYLNGDLQAAASIGTSGQFSANLPTTSLPAGTYTIGFGYVGDSNLLGADATTTFNVIPTSPPQVTLNPTNHTVSAGDPVTFSAAATGVPAPAVQWQMSTDGGTTFNDVTNATGTSYTFTASAYYNGDRFRAVFTNTAGSTTTTSAKFTLESAPHVTSVIINGGAAQRSRVTSVKINFDSGLTLPANPANAFQLQRQSDNASVAMAASVSSGNDTTAVTLTFIGGAVSGASLADGRYTLTALAAQINGGDFDGNNDGYTGDNFVLASSASPNPPTNIFRLAGDADGNGTVDAADFLAFRLAFLQPNTTFDFDGNGTVDAADFLQFRLHFLQSI